MKVPSEPMNSTPRTARTEVFNTEAALNQKTEASPSPKSS